MDTGSRKLHIFGMSETKLKNRKSNNMFKVKGFQFPYRKDNSENGGGGITVYLREGIIAKRQKDLETNNIACLWLEICPNNGKSLARLYESTGRAIAVTSASALLMLKFLVKVLSLYLLNMWMD